MISCSDKEFKDTYKILSGKKKLSLDQKEIISWINENYKINLINIVFDSIKSRKTKEPRIQLITKLDSEKEILINHEYKNGIYDAWDSEELKRILDYILQNYSNLLSGDLKKTFIIVSSFEHAYFEYIISKAGNIISTKLSKILSNENIWKIKTDFSRITLFYYMNNQIPPNKSEIESFVKEKIFDELKNFDIFDLITKDKIQVIFDSKENFDNKYQSNWYYYYL